MLGGSHIDPHGWRGALRSAEGTGDLVAGSTANRVFTAAFRLIRGRCRGCSGG